MGGTKTSKGKESKYANELKLIAEFAKQLVSRRVAIGKTFVEFWSDALLDPVAPCRPVFAVCQLQLTVNTVLLYRRCEDGLLPNKLSPYQIRACDLKWALRGNS